MTRIFVSTWGQNDNIGDSILRRGLVRSLRDGRSRLHVFIGSNDEAYVSALDLAADDVVYRSRDEWWKAALGGFHRDRTWLIQTAGEVIFDNPSRIAGWRTLLGSALARVAGGGGMQVGGGLRDPEAKIPAFERLARRSLRVVAWRDAATRTAFGFGEVAPDWAFGEGTAPEVLRSRAKERPRTKLTLSVRGDGPRPDETTLRAIRELADAHALDIQVLTQVRRDAPVARWLAGRIGATLTPVIWEGETHAEWESVVREVYRESLVVASDRAHVLIVGATEGGLPVGVPGPSLRKVVRLLGPAGFALPTTDDAMAGFVAEHLAEDDPVLARVERARADLVQIAHRMHTAIRGAG